MSNTSYDSLVTKASSIICSLNRRNKDRSIKQVQQFFHSSELEVDFDLFMSHLAAVISDEAVNAEKSDTIVLYAEFCSELAKNPQFKVALTATMRDAFNSFFFEPSIEESEILEMEPLILNTFEFIAYLVKFKVMERALVAFITGILVKNFQKPLAVLSLIALWEAILSFAPIDPWVGANVLTHIKRFSTDLLLKDDVRVACKDFLSSVTSV
ncbi:hypothetical protein GEMRC1_004893 [Eukaryota sp. GEM-RC1]